MFVLEGFIWYICSIVDAPALPNNEHSLGYTGSSVTVRALLNVVYFHSGSCSPLWVLYLPLSQ